MSERGTFGRETAKMAVVAGQSLAWWYIGSRLSAVCLSVDGGRGTVQPADICHHLILPLWACCCKDTISPSFSNVSYRKRQNF